MLLGGVYGDGYRDLQRAALAYVQATMVGGTHPALIEAMGAGNIVFALGTPENREVVGDAALVFETELDLASGLRDLLADPRRLRRRRSARGPGNVRGPGTRGTSSRRPMNASSSRWQGARARHDDRSSGGLGCPPLG